MTIDEAMERLGYSSKCSMVLIMAQDYGALKLGIEALKLVKELRECMPGSAVKLLPGETKGDA